MYHIDNLFALTKVSKMRKKGEKSYQSQLLIFPKISHYSCQGAKLYIQLTHTLTLTVHASSLVLKSDLRAVFSETNLAIFFT